MCFFGHTTTSTRAGRMVRWHRNPTSSFWRDVPGGVRLCSKCYQFASRAVRKHGYCVTKPQSNSEGRRTAEHGIGSASASNVQCRTTVVLTDNAMKIDRTSRMGQMPCWEHCVGSPTQEDDQSHRNGVYPNCATPMGFTVCTGSQRSGGSPGPPGRPSGPTSDTHHPW